MYFRSVWYHLYRGFDPRDLHSRTTLQAGQQLLVALQAEHAQRRLEKEEQPLRRWWRLWQQRGQTERSPQKDDLNCIEMSNKLLPTSNMKELCFHFSR